MRLVSPLLKRVVYPALSRTGYLRHAAKGQLCIVTYHGVLPAGYMSRDSALDGSLISPETLRAQLRLLKSRYHVISPESLQLWLGDGEPLPPLSVLLTCDDGLQNVLTDMLPVLLEEGVRCLFFVTGASTYESRSMLWYEELFLLLLRAPVGRFEILCDGSSIECDLRSKGRRRAVWWSLVKRLSQLDPGRRTSFFGALRDELRLGSWQCFDASDSVSCRRFGLLTRSELQELASAGMTIGAHTLTHPMLSQAPLELACSEIAESRARLESVLQKDVWAFAYPFGDEQSISARVLALAKEAGYLGAFLNFGGGLGTDLPRFAMPRVHVTAEMSLTELEAHVSGFYARLQRRPWRGANPGPVPACINE